MRRGPDSGRDRKRHSTRARRTCAAHAADGRAHRTRHQRRRHVMKIGLCGTGRMGGAIVLRLLEVGHDVTVWNRDMSKTKPLVEAGAKAATTPAALAQGNEVVITMLLDAAAIE